ncbi:MAG: patatin-like phospholipase family protein [Actinobacteria bacterium]|nr:patatin-like phospholipase family protein [Actinomycetota bacterium]
MSHWIGDLPRPLAFVLSGGASLGATQVGMLEALAEVGAEPDVVVGSSVGSLNGAVLAGCGDVGAAARRLRATWEGLRTADVFPRGVLRQARNLTRQRTLYSSEGLRRLIDRSLPVRSFETLRIPLAVVAVDARTGHSVTLVEGPLLPALLASTAIPGLLPPVRVGRRTLWDGGVTDQVPLVPAVSIGARAIVVLDAGDVCHLDTAPRPLPEGIVLALNTAIRQRVLLEAPLLARRVPLVYLPRPCARNRNPLDLDSAATLIDPARHLTSEFLATAGPPADGAMAGHPHMHEDGAYSHPALVASTPDR